jgi:hypothetical protein
VHRVRPAADRHTGAHVPFCACENKLKIGENSGDGTAKLVEIRPELCLFVPTKISAIVRKLLKRLGVPDGI